MFQVQVVQWRAIQRMHDLQGEGLIILAKKAQLKIHHSAKTKTTRSRMRSVWSPVKGW